MNQRNPVRQHTVPCSYLQGFGEIEKGRDTILWSLNVKDGNVLKTSASHLTIEKDFYTLYIDGVHNYDFEKFLSIIEGRIPPIISKIRTKITLSERDIIDLSEFLVLQMMRSVTTREGNKKNNGDLIKLSLHEIYRHLEDKNERMHSLKRFISEHFGYDAPENELNNILEKFESGEEIEFESRNQEILHMIQIYTNIGEIARRRQWSFLHIKDSKAFITSDYPLYISPFPDSPKFYGNGGFIGSQYIGFPLTKSIYLLISEHVKGKMEPVHINFTNNDLIRQFNYWTAYGTHRWLIGSSSHLLCRIYSVISMADQKYKENSN